MANLVRPITELFLCLKTLLPRRPESVPGGFWMPDDSCRVCYDCDATFTLWYRRHHCRLCGRVFCGKCTANTVSNSSHDANVIRQEGEGLRVCNFCFRRFEEESVDSQNATQQSDGGCHSNLETPRFQQSEYYSQVEFDEGDRNYQSNNLLLAEEYTNAGDVCCPVDEDAELNASIGAEKMAEDTGTDNSYEDDGTSVYGKETTDAEPVDIENNGLLWLPPEPEDEDDEREPALFDSEEDDEDITGEWGYLHSSNSFGSGEYRSKYRPGEEYKKAIKNVVDGHFRALIAQRLQIENLPMGEKDDSESWLVIITSLSWEATTLFKPDTSKGGGMDPCGYVKVKCLACGHPSQSMVVRGIVCEKNVADRRMSLRIEKPRILMLGGALEYQPVISMLSGFDSLRQQEMDHLKIAVAKIDAYNPSVLLVEKSVSRSAQEYLLEKDVSLVMNIKRPLLERMSQCTGSQIVPSIDHLSSQKLGLCDLFHVEKFFEEHGSVGQGGKKLAKTLMFFEGCPEPLGCTILLRGANGDELKKVKHIVQYGVFSAYHLAAETSFLADEGASLPELSGSYDVAVANGPDEQTTSKDEYSSSDDQSILVSLSTRCMWKGVVCEPSHLFRIKFYGNLDKTLGRFLRDHLFDLSYKCHSCDMPSEAHVHSFTHRQGGLTIYVKKLPECALPGERHGKIWTWRRCLRCPRDNWLPPTTRRIVMSDAALGLSFGQFLELSFSNNAAASSVASCGHSLHRDCLRFYGLGKVVACFQYASVDPHPVYLPQKEGNEVPVEDKCFCFPFCWLWNWYKIL